MAVKETGSNPAGTGPPLGWLGWVVVTGTVVVDAGAVLAVVVDVLAPPLVLVVPELSEAWLLLPPQAVQARARAKPAAGRHESVFPFTG